MLKRTVTLIIAAIAVSGCVTTTDGGIGGTLHRIVNPKYHEILEMLNANRPTTALGLFRDNKASLSDAQRAELSKKWLATEREAGKLDLEIDLLTRGVVNTIDDIERIEAAIKQARELKYVYSDWGLEPIFHSKLSSLKTVRDAAINDYKRKVLEPTIQKDPSRGYDSAEAEKIKNIYRGDKLKDICTQGVTKNNYRDRISACKNLGNFSDAIGLIAFSDAVSDIPSARGKIIAGLQIAATARPLSGTKVGIYEVMEWLNKSGKKLPIEDLAEGKLPSDENIGIYISDLVVKDETKTNNKKSQFKSGETTTPNPAYRSAEFNYHSAIEAIRTCERQYMVDKAYNPYTVNMCGILNWRVNSALELLSAMPTHLTKDVFSNYFYKEIVHDISRTASLNVVLTSNDNVFLASCPASDSKSFTIVKGVDANDSTVLVSSYSTESDLRKHLDTVIGYDLVPCLEKAVSNTPITKTIYKESIIRNVIKNTEEHRPAGIFDKALGESVVVVENDSGIGSGFYVDNSYIITNAHVVDGTPVVQLRKKNGERSTGVVVKIDMDLDLALIATSSKGVPLQLSNFLPQQGENVYALGHPSAFEFSVTRGIVSAVRERGEGMNKHKEIQTDAALSPGNSGGPLVSEKGIAFGVNTSKRVGKAEDGLGFAVSAPVVKAFINLK